MNLVVHLAKLSLKAYKLLLSPALHAWVGPGAGCRFTPTCSEYAAEAVQYHGLLCGARLAVSRLCRCHPWGGSGFDPVPQATAASAVRNREVPSSATSPIGKQECSRLAAS